MHHVVVVGINGYKFRALFDSGANPSCASSTAIKLIGAKRMSAGIRQIAMLTGVTSRKMQVYDAHIESFNENFTLDVKITKTEKDELPSLEDPLFMGIPI